MKNIVLILGAGSSCDYGFPTGNELCELIGDTATCDLVIKDLEYYPKMNERVDYIHGLNSIKEYFFKSRINSIDAWLAKEENKECANAAKLLIAYHISQFENMEFTQKGFFKKLFSHKKSDWYQELYNQLVTDKFEDFPRTRDRLTIVTFNYDISLEYFLINCLINTYPGYLIEEYQEKFNKIKIIHVYGSLSKASS